MQHNFHSLASSQDHCHAGCLVSKQCFLLQRAICPDPTHPSAACQQEHDLRFLWSPHSAENSLTWQIHGSLGFILPYTSMRWQAAGALQGIPGFTTTSNCSLQSEVGKRGCEFPSAPTTSPSHPQQVGDVLAAVKGAASQHGHTQILCGSSVSFTAIVSYSPPPLSRQQVLGWGGGCVMCLEWGVWVLTTPLPHGSRQHLPEPPGQGKQEEEPAPACSEHRTGNTSLVWEPWHSLSLILGQPCGITTKAGVYPIHCRCPCSGRQVPQMGVKSPPTRHPGAMMGALQRGGGKHSHRPLRWDRGGSQPRAGRDPGLNRAAPPPSPWPPLRLAERKCLQKSAAGDFLEKGRGEGAC